MREQKIARITKNIRDKLVKTRRDFYMHPELSGEEKRTASVVAERLRQIGLEVATGIGGHGVIGLVKGENGGAIAAWRADMDAFSVQDVLEVPYKSQVAGVKHVCGHDVHTTIGLGIAEVLSSMREEIAGSIKLIFQPAEETAIGAQNVIKAGGLENPRPEAIFALHVMPFPVGKIGCVPGTVCPGLHMFEVIFKRGSDSSEVSSALAKEWVEKLHSLNVPGFPSNREEWAALFRSLVKGSEELTRSVIVACWPETEENTEGITRLTGFVRANKERLEEAEAAIHTNLDMIAEKSSVAYQLKWGRSVPALINNAQLEEELRPAIEKAIGVENVFEIKAAFPYNSEDFAQYLQKIPGVFYWLGVANMNRGISGIPHSPEFDVDEDSLVVGTKAMSNLLLAYLDFRKEKCIH